MTSQKLDEAIIHEAFARQPEERKVVLLISAEIAAREAIGPDKVASNLRQALDAYATAKYGPTHTKAEEFVSMQKGSRCEVLLAPENSNLLRRRGAHLEFRADQERRDRESNEKAAVQLRPLLNLDSSASLADIAAKLARKGLFELSNRVEKTPWPVIEQLTRMRDEKPKPSKFMSALGSKVE